MFYDEEKATIVAYRAEIDENPEYGHIKKLIEEHPLIWTKFNKESIIIFDVLKTYDGDKRIRGDELYVDTLCICEMEIMYDYSSSTTMFSKKSYSEQLKEITMEYHEHGYTIADLEKLNIPQVHCENEPLNYAIVPVIVENYIGTCEEYGIEPEDEEENEVFDESDKRTGTGTIRIPFNEDNKEQKKTLVEKKVNAARADGVDASYVEGVSDFDHESPEFVLKFPSVTKAQIMMYNDMSCGIL